jgi:hypothetical protein
MKALYGMHLRLDAVLYDSELLERRTTLTAWSQTEDMKPYATYLRLKSLEILIVCAL